MNSALSFLSAGTESQSVIDILQSYTETADKSIAQQQLADPNYWGSVGIITVTGILVVFFILAILIAVFWGMGQFFKSKDKRKIAKAEAAKAAAAASAPAPAPAPVEEIEDTDDSDDDEIIAVISAAIAAYSEADGKQYAIRSIRRKDNKSRSAWSLAGIGDNTRPF